MSQKYKIFINDKLLFLVDNPAKVDEILTTQDHYIIKPYKDESGLKELLELLLGAINKSNMVIYHADVAKLKKDLFKLFIYIKAAGGLVTNDEEKILLIHRRGAWDLPKGKLEKKETLEEAAIREVEEETGVKKLQLGDAITFGDLANKCTYHTYMHKGKVVMKASYWYHMSTVYAGRLEPQSEEDIEEVKWVAKSELEDYIPDMYDSIVDVLKYAL